MVGRHRASPTRRSFFERSFTSHSSGVRSHRKGGSAKSYKPRHSMGIFSMLSPAKRGARSHVDYRPGAPGVWPGTRDTWGGKHAAPVSKRPRGDWWNRGAYGSWT